MRLAAAVTRIHIAQDTADGPSELLNGRLPIKTYLITDFPQPRKGWYETGIPHGTMRL